MKRLASLLSTHLLTTTTIAIILGIGIAPALSQHNVSTAIIRIAALSLLIVSFILFLKAEKTNLYITLPLLMLCCGYLYGFNHLQQPQSSSHIYNIIEEKNEVVLLARLQQMTAYDGQMSRATVDVQSLQLKNSEQRQAATGLVQLSLRGVWPEDIRPGDMLLVRADVKRPHSPATIGAFDYTRFLAQKDIWITGFVRSQLFITKVSENKSALQNIRFLDQRWRSQIGSFLDNNLEPEKAATYRALLLGDRSRISENTLELFKASGTFHILAISGLHLSVIALLLYAVLYFLLSRSEYLLLYYSVKKIVAVLTIPLLIIYALLAGMNSPVTRAVIMTTVVLIALCSERKKSPAAVVSVAALLILIFDPNALFTVSFQLSFSAIIGILLILPVIEKILRKDKARGRNPSLIIRSGHYLLSLFLVSVAATITTAPFSISNFHRISLIGPVANLFVEPLICLWTLPAGMVALIFMKFVPPLSVLLLNFGYSGFGFTLKILAFLTNFPFAYSYLATPSWTVFVYLFLFVGAGIAVYIFRNKKPENNFAFITFLFVLLWSLTYELDQKTPSRVTFIDLGQGSSTLIETAHKTILIDGGGSSFSQKHVGETVIAPLLWSKGIKKIDTMIITHPDADHYNGLPFIVDHFSPEQIWLRDRDGHDDNYSTFVRNAENMGTTLIIGEAGNEILDGNFRLRSVFNLYDTTSPQTIDSGVSNDSLIIQACFDEFCFLFPGDINEEMEDHLLSLEPNLRSDVLLAAHHGAKTSNSMEFLSDVQPSQAVVSAARSSTGYFPHASFLTKCRQLGIDVLTTADKGTIEFVIDGQNVYVNNSERFQGNTLYPIRSNLLKTLVQQE